MKGIYLTALFLSSIGSIALAQENFTDKIPSKLQSHFIFNHGQETAGATEVLGFPAFERYDSNNNLRTGLDYKSPIQQVGALSTEVLEMEKRTGRAVLRANFVVNVTREETQADGSLRKVVLSHQGNGSAIVVGKKYVLTNRHVLDVLKKDQNPMSCPEGFITSGEDSSLKVQCKTVIACGLPQEKIVIPNAKDPSKLETFSKDNFDDWCLIEVTQTADGRNIGDQVEPLRIPKKVRFNKKDKVATIGNPAGKGIQASWGSMKSAPSLTKKTSPVLNTTAFALSGNSGGALINSRGQLIGLVYSSETYDAQSASALNLEHVAKRLSETVSPEIMAEITASEELENEEINDCEEEEAHKVAEPKRLGRWFKKVKKFFELSKDPSLNE